MSDTENDRERRQLVGLLMQTTSFAEGQPGSRPVIQVRC